jgi:HEAT repeat protein
MKAVSFQPWIARCLALLLTLSPCHLVALSSSKTPEQAADLRKQLKDPSPKVRLRAAKAMAESSDAEAIPVLIDLLAELPAGERQTVEDFLKELAGEWAPNLQFATDDDISRGVRRDAWAAWWRRADAPRLLAVLAQHTLTDDKRRTIQDLLAQLGSNDFKVREEASRQLFPFGRLALPQLHEAAKDRDAEVARRAKMLCERIENGADMDLPIAALRLLAVRKPAGAVEALLAYLPFAEDEVREEEVRKALAVLALREGKVDPALRRGLAASSPKVRAVAAEALIQGGGTEGRAAARTLLAEDVPSVRLLVALALARTGERGGIAALIDLLPLLSPEEFSQAEDVLYQLAGDSSAKLSENAASDDKKKCRDAWAAWWKANGSRVELGRLTVRPLLGYTLICEQNRVLEMDRQGKIRWSIRNLAFPTDAWVLPGKRVLIVEWNASRVTERDWKGNILWKKDGLPNHTVYAQRLTNGNTFIGIREGMVLEVDRAGKEVYKIDKIPGMLYAYRSRQGAIVCLTQKECLILDTTGKPLRHFAIKHPIVSRGGLDLLPNGHILIASEQAGKVMEYDSQGRLLHEWNVPQVTTATGLPNGHLLASSPDNNRVVELDRDGRAIWEQKFDQAYRARRR